MVGQRIKTLAEEVCCPTKPRDLILVLLRVVRVREAKEGGENMRGIHFTRIYNKTYRPNRKTRVKNRSCHAQQQSSSVCIHLIRFEWHLVRHFFVCVSFSFCLSAAIGHRRHAFTSLYISVSLLPLKHPSYARIQWVHSTTYWSCLSVYPPPHSYP